MKILEERQNKLLHRKEVLVNLESETKSTPSRAEVAKQVAPMLKAKEDVIFVYEIEQEYGQGCKAEIFVYDKKENLDKIHFYRKKKVLKEIRDKDLADRKAVKEAAAKPAEAPAEVKPAEVKA
ncbi:MAG: hypothetical protein Q8R00_02095 [Candidatus Nanoarchaeia archaeon]|nr:hypothetical protein [Candidatus Nanoarchaeia archaeon]